MNVSRTAVAWGLAIFVLVNLPLTVGAQTNAGLEATIRAAILTDPRTAGMSESDIDALVLALVQGAEAQGVSANDIEWQPQGPVLVEEVAEGSCGIMPVFFCMLSGAFGLDGSDVTIPILLGICAGILIFVIGAMLHHRYGHHPVIGKLAAAPPSNPSMTRSGFDISR